MKTGLPSLVAPSLAIGIVLIVCIFLLDGISRETTPKINVSATTSVASVAAVPQTKASSTTETRIATPPSAKPVTSATTSKPVISQPTKSQDIQPESTSTQVRRVENPYTFAPSTTETMDTLARGATVNILCMPRSGSFRPTSGSGVIIDPRGVILTNAHVAQYILLAQSGKVDLSCTIRTGSPSVPHWIPEVLFVPPIWVKEHFTEIRTDRPTGTGEHDYALLIIAGDLQGNSPSEPFPYIPVDTRENIAFLNDTVLVAGYPAEFAGGIAASRGLYAATSIANVRQLLTFETGSVDVFSVGGVIEAQGGSSGGPAVNPWNHVVGIVTTTSEGATTADRDLHINTLSYINRDLSIQSGNDLAQILASDVSKTAQLFEETIAPNLVEKYISVLTR